MTGLFSLVRRRQPIPVGKQKRPTLDGSAVCALHPTKAGKHRNHI